MKATAYSASTLFCEQISCSELLHQFASPLYIYSYEALNSAYQAYLDAFAEIPTRICYAVKANDNLAILSLFQKWGAGADVVSGGEMFKALEAGIDPQKIVFSGVGKSKDELEYAIRRNIQMITLESIEEFETLSNIAKGMQKKVRVSVRFNPNVDPKTHAYISTGLKGNKFGLPQEEVMRLYGKIKGHEYIEPVGISMHIGSQLTDVSPLIHSARIAMELVRELKKMGISLKFFDVGGGVGIPYTPDTKLISLREYAMALAAETKGENLEIVLEPGRSLVAEAGVLLTKVMYVKRHSGKTFVIVDAAMNDLIRPSLYQAYHSIIPVHKIEGEKIKVDIVGPICESGDYFAKDREMVLPQEDSILCIEDAGAYGTVMSSQYNMRPRVAEVLVKGDQVELIRIRESFEDLIKRDRIPSFVGKI